MEQQKQRLPEEGPSAHWISSHVLTESETGLGPHLSSQLVPHTFLMTQLGVILSPGDMWQCLGTYWLLLSGKVGWGCCWHGIGRCQGCCLATYSTQNRPRDREWSGPEVNHAEVERPRTRNLSLQRDLEPHESRGLSASLITSSPGPNTAVEVTTGCFSQNIIRPPPWALLVEGLVGGWRSALADCPLRFCDLGELIIEIIFPLHAKVGCSADFNL